jgi:hypothetical protein
MSNDDTRYPYTYACDYIRSLAGYGVGGTKLSRGDASQIMKGIASAMGQPNHHSLACALADHYKANEQEIAKKDAVAFMSALYGEQQ